MGASHSCLRVRRPEGTSHSHTEPSWPADTTVSLPKFRIATTVSRCPCHVHMGRFAVRASHTRMRVSLLPVKNTGSPSEPSHTHVTGAAWPWKRSMAPTLLPPPELGGNGAFACLATPPRALLPPPARGSERQAVRSLEQLMMRLLFPPLKRAPRTAAAWHCSAPTQDSFSMSQSRTKPSALGK